MSFKFGDKVLVKSTIIGTDKTLDGKIGCHVGKTPSALFWVDEDDICPIAANDKSYTDGMNDAWEIARKLFNLPDVGGFTDSELEGIFGCDWRCAINEYTATEAAEKIAKWEESKKIHVGDIVRTNAFEGVVTCITGDWMSVIQKDGKSMNILMDLAIKTGRKVDVDGFLRQIGGSQ